MDPVSLKVTEIGEMDCPGSVIDIAVGKDGEIIGTTSGNLVKINKTTAKCSSISSGSYPNSLSFLPAGTLFSDREALVGYQGDTYVEINPQTGKLTQVGKLGNSLSSSGDIVSVKDGGTYLTVKGNDCVVKVNPKTGAMEENLGKIPL